jgi:hypothetical protein
MALNTAEHLAATQMFINERPVNVVFTRVSKASDGQGGWVKTGPTPLAAQQVRKVATSRLADVSTRVTENGAVVVPTAYLIGMPTLNVQRYDKCVIDGVPHEVVFVGRLPEWRIQAEVVETSG